MKQSILVFLLVALSHSAFAGAPQNTRILPGTIADTEVMIFWDKPSDYKDMRHYSVSVNGKEVGTTEKNNFKITGLQPSADYKVTVAAHPKKGKAAAGNTIAVSTKPAPEIFNVVDYGATGDGKTLDTKAIQKAIDDCTPYGEVYIPAGEYITGALFILKNDISIHLAEGAILKASHNLGNFPMVKTIYEGWKVDVYSSVLNLGDLDSGKRYSNIRIYGPGTIDNQGNVLADIQTKVISRMARSHGLPITNCENVAIDGITLTNPCTWNVHPLLCEGLTTNNVNLISAALGLSNADCWDPDSSSDCYLLNSVLDGQDDNVSIKSVRYITPEGKEILKPSENIYISYCRFVRGGGLCVGVEMPAGVRNVWFTDCVVENSDRGFQIHNRPEGPGAVENLNFRDITVHRTGCWGINVNMWYWVPSYMPGSFKPEDLRKVSNITFENIHIMHADGNPIQVLGMPEQPISDITFKNVTIDSSDYDVLLRDCRNITFENVDVGEKYWRTDGVENLKVDKKTSKPKVKAYPYKMVDPDATFATKALYANLHKVAESGKFMFGAQDATASGYGWHDDSGVSDIERVSGSMPAFYSWDYMHIASPYRDNMKDDHAKVRRLTCEAFYNGGVNSYCWHFSNPVTGGSFYDTSVNVVPMILPGGEYHDVFVSMLDIIVEFNKTLIGKDGEHIPIIFRPWHEFDGDWFWWGSKYCTAEEFKELFRFTVTYLRDTRGVRNFIYAFSPDCKYTTTEEYLERYPGDEYVDVIATDNYWDFRYDEKDLGKVHNKLKIISDYARATGKVAALTETGQNGVEDTTWYTGRLLKAIYGYPDEVKLAYVAIWRNSVAGFFSPYPGHPAASDFIDFTKDPRIIMGSRYDYLGKFYHMD